MSIKKMIARRIESKRTSASCLNKGRKVAPLEERHSQPTSASEGHAATLRRKRSRARLKRVARWLGGRSKQKRKFARQVEKTLVPLLPSNRATAEGVAERLGLSRQTLHRRLQAEGTTFTEILSVKRRKLAIRYLGREKAPVKVVAWRLGFSSPEAFSRAFKRWTGTSPGCFQSSSG